MQLCEPSPLAGKNLFPGSKRCSENVAEAHPHFQSFLRHSIQAWGAYGRADVGGPLSSEPLWFMNMQLQKRSGQGILASHLMWWKRWLVASYTHTYSLSHFFFKAIDFGCRVGTLWTSILPTGALRVMTAKKRKPQNSQQQIFGDVATMQHSRVISQIRIQIPICRCSINVLHNNRLMLQFKVQCTSLHLCRLSRMLF